jgi:hypothetical protein
MQDRAKYLAAVDKLFHNPVAGACVPPDHSDLDAFGAGRKLTDFGKACQLPSG